MILALLACCAASYGSTKFAILFTQQNGLGLKKPQPFFLASMALSATLAIAYLALHQQQLNIGVISIAASTPALCVVDFKLHRLPNAITYSLLAISLGQSAINLLNNTATLQSVLLGLIPGFALLAINFASRGAIGLGDVKLMFPLGITLATISTGFLYPAMLVAFSSAAIWVLGGLVAKRINLKASIAFGPFLLLGFWVALFARLS